MRGLGKISEALFRGLRVVDSWIGLPLKAEESLHFRLGWRRSLPVRVSDATALWIHGASVGELEDLAAFFSDAELLAQAGYSPERLVLTASSISSASKLQSWGQELGLRYAGPLPPESSPELEDFFHRLRPDLLVLSHSDIWPRALEEARTALPRGALWLPQRTPEPTALQRACLGGLVRRVGLREPSAAARDVLEVPADFVGNPRIDRIVRRIEAARRRPEHVLEKHGAAPQRGRVSLILGSAWTEDAEMLAQALDILGAEKRRALQLVVFPHEVRNSPVVGGLQRILPEARVLPLEGILLESFRDFTAAFIGGGFRTGLHSVLEPALWERPTLCGPDLRKQPQASSLRDGGLLRTIHRPEELAAQLDLILGGTPETASNRELWQRASAETAARLWNQKGAAERLALLIRSL